MAFSICIPTLNRPEMLAQCVEAFLKQGVAASEYEIVVLDGGSKPAADLQNRQICRQSPNIHYHVSTGKGGIDEDILEMVGLASGDYCWLMGDDDIPLPNALDRVIKFLSSSYVAGASLNYISFEPEMKYSVAAVPASGRRRLKADHLFTDRAECFKNLGVHLGYISGQVVMRSLWMGCANSNFVSSQIGSCWIVTAVISRMLSEHPVWAYIHEPCIGNRTQNDSFVARMGVYRRQLLAHDAYEKLIVAAFPDRPDVLDQIKLTLIYDRMPRTLAKLRAAGAGAGLLQDLFRLYLTKYGRYPSFWFMVAPLFLIPNVFFRAVQVLYVRYRRFMGHT